MRCAIYARRSTEEQAESLETQIDNARRFIAGRAWSVAEHLVFAESGSRAEFVKRRGLAAMLVAAEAKAFDVLVLRDESRLGGDSARTMIALEQLAGAGVRVFHYASGEEMHAPDNALSRIVLNVRNGLAELERERISSRTRENLERKARRGLVAGGILYGYRNVASPDGAGKVREIVPEQANVVREIFERAARGEGHRTIAKALNARGVPSPRAGKRGTGSWSCSTVHAMLRHELYIGRATWGRRRKGYRGGTKVRTLARIDELIAVDLPHLRIVDAETWRIVRAATARREKATGTTKAGPRVRHMLSGVARCAACGGPMRADNTRASYVTVKAYACAYHRDRGDSVCTNKLRRPVAGVDAAVVATLRRTITEENLIGEVLAGVRRRIAALRPAAKETRELEKRARMIQRAMGRLTATLIETETKPRTLAAKLDEQERMLRDVEAQIEAARVGPRVFDLESRRIETEARRRLEELGELVAANPAEARKVIEAVSSGPLRFVAVETPDGPRYRIEGEIALARIAVMECSSAQVPLGTRTVLHALEGVRVPWEAVA